MQTYNLSPQNRSQDRSVKGLPKCFRALVASRTRRDTSSGSRLLRLRFLRSLHNEISFRQHKPSPPVGISAVFSGSNLRSVARSTSMMERSPTPNIPRRNISATATSAATSTGPNSCGARRNPRGAASDWWRIGTFSVASLTSATSCVWPGVHTLHFGAATADAGYRRPHRVSIRGSVALQRFYGCRLQW